MTNGEPDFLHPRAGNDVYVLGEQLSLQVGRVVGWYTNDESSALVRLAGGAVERVRWSALRSMESGKLVA